MSDLQEAHKKAPKKPALGRGLGSLLGEAAARHAPQPNFEEQDDASLKEGFVETKLTASPAPTAPSVVVRPSEPSGQLPDHVRVWTIDIAKIVPNAKQPRRVFAAPALAELSNSIKQKGILQPITARRLKDGNFEIIAGERRWRAAQAAGLHEVPVILKAADDQNTLELALIENIQREDLNPIEEAEAYQYLITKYEMTQQQLAEKVGKDRVTVANTLRLLGLVSEVRSRLVAGEISMGHAKVLLAITDPKAQSAMAHKIFDKGLSVRELEREVAQLLKPKANTDESGHQSLTGDMSQKFMAGLGLELQKIIGTKVTIDYAHGKGKIAVHFYSDDELNGIVDRIKDAWHK